uniref:Uncharacterized protein n=1 Tax=Nymphaea colorata TaxID=210225 RepID=A0A5K0X2I2_9MAGN
MTPMVTQSWKPMTNAPRHWDGAISEMYTGADWLMKPTPKPSKRRPTMSIAIWIAPALMNDPSKKAMPPKSMLARRPKARVTFPAPKDAAKPAMKMEEVKAVRSWLLNMQYPSRAFAMLICFKTKGKKL